MESRTYADPYEPLTPREQEVLALLRRGLTNAEIAAELGISLDGAKYHVSEIIGKLGLRNRYEAAVWPERRWWALSPLAPLVLWWRRSLARAPGALGWAAGALSVALFAAALTGLGVLIAALLRNPGGAPGPVEADVCPSRLAPEFAGEVRTYDEVARRAAEAASCPGYVLVITAAGDFNVGPYSMPRRTNIWVDLEHRRARVTWTQTITAPEVVEEYAARGEAPPEMKTDTIYIENASYYRQYWGEDQDQFSFSTEVPCFEAGGVPVEQVIPCDEPGPTEDVTFTVERDASYRGRAAIALVKSGTARGSDETYDTITRLYIDPATFLPIGQTITGTLNDINPVEFDFPYQYRFVAVESLPENLFDPASLGYLTDDFVEKIEAAGLEVPVYWLGEGLPGSEGLPPLVLDSVFVYGDVDDENLEIPVPLLRFNYRTPEEEEGVASVRLRVYTPDDWRRYRDQSWLAGDREIALPFGRAVIHQLGGGFDNFMAHVDAGGTVTLIEAPLRFKNGSQTPMYSAYDTEAAIERLVRSLERLR